MSTTEQEVQLPPGLISSRTIANSILSEGRDRRLEPEDLRTRRFGYNPGLIMPADPTWSGLQSWVVPRGVAVLFETATVSRQKHSVDANDRTPPNELVDFLAGEGLGNVFHIYGSKGFRELRPLRGLTDPQAGRLFHSIHPRLRDCWEMGALDPCPYGPKECSCLDHLFSPISARPEDVNTCLCGQEKGTVTHQGECEYCTYVCITCRQNHLKKLKNAPDAARGVLTLVNESVMVGRTEMFTVWRGAIGEVASWNGGKSVEMALKALNDDHLFFMRQLHERTPQDQDLARYEMQQKAQAENQRQMLEQNAQLISASLNARGTQDYQETEDLKARLAVMEQTLAKLTAPPVDEAKADAAIAENSSTDIPPTE